MLNAGLRGQILKAAGASPQLKVTCLGLEFHPQGFLLQHPTYRLILLYVTECQPSEPLGCSDLL